MYGQKALEAGTSPNIWLQFEIVQEPGLEFSIARQMNLAIAWRWTLFSGQYWVSVQPLVTPECSIVSMKA
jgi:hypothetical protein